MSDGWLGLGAMVNVAVGVAIRSLQDFGTMSRATGYYRVPGTTPLDEVDLKVMNIQPAQKRGNACRVA